MLLLFLFSGPSLTFFYQQAAIVRQILNVPLKVHWAPNGVNLDFRIRAVYILKLDWDAFIVSALTVCSLSLPLAAVFTSTSIIWAGQSATDLLDNH